MNYTELSVATQDVMPNKGVLFFNQVFPTLFKLVSQFKMKMD